ncbi:STE/STE11/BCK1 protein kinase [Puccinia triticina 1-1 BBBD Race 1]|uniref:Protein kinase domain-containing protein n=1 Tax=Puccinia triticina (isolate 1-1 / race 1 (BBBD)) TaxID=630390 RepID=A0A180H351_PUCT1|nr:STE/STE11/BCK1 protein kinase [Puccinia triticina 1-1 BBBD Race 1]
MSFGDRAQAASESRWMALRTPANMASSSAGPKYESYPPMQRLQRHSADSLSTSSCPNSRYSSQLIRTPALYYGCVGPRNQVVAEQSRVMVQHPTAFRYATSNTPVLVVPQVSHRKTVSTMDSTIVQRGPAEWAFQRASRGPDVEQDVFNQPHNPIDHDRPTNLRITTEFGSSRARSATESGHQHGLPESFRILITKNFDLFYFISLPEGILAASIVDKIFARYEIPQQERSSWSIFRVSGVQPVGHALDPLEMWQECLAGLAADREKVLMFIILPSSSNPELMSSHLGGLLNSTDCPPEYEETIPSASQVFSPEHPLSGLSSAPQPHGLEEIHADLAEQPHPDPACTDEVQSPRDAPPRGDIGRRVSFIHAEHVASIRNYPVTPPIRISELESSPGGDRGAFSSQQGSSRWLPWHSPPFGSLDYSVNENGPESPFQYAGSLSPGHSQRPDSSHLSESSSDRILQPLYPRKPGSQSALQLFPATHAALDNQNKSSSKVACQTQCRSDMGSDKSSAPMERSEPIEVDHSIRSSPAPPDLELSSSKQTSTDSSQSNLGGPSSGEYEEEEGNLSDGKESFSTCPLSDFPPLQENGQAEDSNTSQTDRSETSEPDPNSNVTWLDELLADAFSSKLDDAIEDTFFSPRTEVNTITPSSSAEDLSDESLLENPSATTPEIRPSDSQLNHPSLDSTPDCPTEVIGNVKEDGDGFPDFEAGSEDDLVSDGFQVPMKSGTVIERDYGAHEAHLPPYDSAGHDQRTKQPPTESEPEEPEQTVRKARSEENIFADRRCWATRPNIEKVCDHLETSFPNHNIDQPIVRILKHPQNSHQCQKQSSSQRVSRVLSIRSTVSSRKQRRHQPSLAPSLATVDSPRATHLPESPVGSNEVPLYSSPRNSIKLWGFKTEEILPGSQAEVAPDPSGQESPFASQKWVKGKLIGSGSFGRVYLALNLTNQAMMAVKQVKTGDRNSNRPSVKPALESIKLEIRFLKDLEHPSIVQYLGFEDTPEHCNIFLEYVEGGSIGSCVGKHGKLERDVVKSFTKQILEGLAYLHSCNIMHRDLKADNVLVDLMGRCKISDFGISKRSHEAYQTSQYTPMQGTVFSMAPEVFDQKMGCRYSAKADIWSLGCLVLEMLCGSRAWHGLGCLQIIYKVGIERRTPEIPQELQTCKFQSHFLKKCLEIQPSSRPTARRLIDHLFVELDPEWDFQKSELFKVL